MRSNSGELRRRASTSRGSTELPRRRVLVLGAVLAESALAGCNEIPGGVPELSGGYSDEPAGNPYTDLRETLELARKPWRQTPEGVARQMSEEMAVQAAHLGGAAVRGSSLSGLKSAGEAVATSFQLLEEGETSFNRELIRAEMTEATQATPELREFYQQLGGMDRRRPYLPLFNALIRDLGALEDSVSETRVQMLRTDAKTVWDIFQLSWWVITQGATGSDDPLLSTLEYLRATVNTLKGV